MSHGYLPTLSRPGMNMIHEMLVRLGYTVDCFGQYGDIRGFNVAELLRGVYRIIV